MGKPAAFCNSGSPLGVRDLETVIWSKGIMKLPNIADEEVEKAASARTQDELVRYTEQAFRKVYDQYIGVPIFKGGVVYAANKKFPELPITPTWDNFAMWLVHDRPR